MEELVKTVNKLQDVFNVSGYKNIDLPQVVVVGSQSSGKSSVLEHLVGKSFLPRGSGIVTRCPIVLQLAKSEDEEYAVFQHSPKTFKEYPLICEEIQKETDRLAGGNKGICKTPIILKLFSPNHLDLTLVDLPGMTKVPVGDQPQDIDEQTRSLTLEYIRNPKSIILAVIPANADMATSESLRISRDVDPNGERTLAVVTKLDLMDKGTDALDMLNGNIIPVKLGIIGVVNRSQKDIMDGKSIKDSLDDEALFFQETYEDIAFRHGTDYLKKTVQGMLIDHIKSCLPELKENVSQQLADRRAELLLVGESALDGSTQLLYLITNFCTNYCSTIKGNLPNIETNELFGGARIHYVFQNTLFNTLESIDALSGLSKSAILTALKNAAGANPALFVPEIAFELLIKRQIRKLRSPCLQCVDLVHGELIKIEYFCLQDRALGLKRYPKLQQEISNVIRDLLKKRIPIANEMIQNFIDVQLSYINTSHPDFIRNIPSLRDKKTGNPMPFFEYLRELPMGAGGSNYEDRSERDYNLIKELIQSYFSIVKESTQDTVPKIIMHFMVNDVMNNLQAQLVSKLYSRDTLSKDLLSESSEVLAERNRLEKSVSSLERANEALNTLSSTYLLALT